MSAAPATRNSHQYCAKPLSAPSTSAYVSELVPTAISTAPGMSSRPTRAVSCWRQRPARANQIVATATGRLRRKIQRHDAHSTSAPPTGGPAIVTTPVNDVQRPTARPASFPYVSRSSARLFVVTNAPAMP